MADQGAFFSGKYHLWKHSDNFFWVFPFPRATYCASNLECNLNTMHFSFERYRKADKHASICPCTIVHYPRHAVRSKRSSYFCIDRHVNGKVFTTTMITRSYIAAAVYTKQSQSHQFLSFSRCRFCRFIRRQYSEIESLLCFGVAGWLPACLLIQHSIFCAWSHVFASELDVCVCILYESSIVWWCVSFRMSLLLRMCVCVRVWVCLSVYLFYPQLISSVRLCVSAAYTHLSVLMRVCI